MDRSRALTTFGVGVVAGVLSGLLGVGGGIVMVPGLVLLLGLSQHRAHATSLAAIVPIAVAGAATFGIGGRVNYALAGLVGVGAVLGAPLGVRLLARLPEAMLRLAFVAASLAAAVRLLV